MTNERRDYYPPDEIVSQAKISLAMHSPGEIDWITFVGSGEPALHSSLGWMIREVKAISDLPVAVITNGSLLYKPGVREELLVADAVLPSLDAGSNSLYRKINRPHPDLTFSRIITGLTAFRRQYAGKLWIELMLIRGVNDTEEALSDLAHTLRGINPDEVHVSLPIRPPAETWVEPADEEGLMRATAVLGEVARIIHPVQGEFDLTGCSDVTDAVIGVITRHPMREEELVQTLDRWTAGQVARALAELNASDQARTVERYGQRFWAATKAKYSDKRHSGSHTGTTG
jgi:wyosine [tRNA(Phe)-imidazoG37] synthetase (radical SAM superfamily)